MQYIKCTYYLYLKGNDSFSFSFHINFVLKNVNQLLDFAGIKVKKGKWSNLEYDLLEFNMVHFLEVQLIQ